MAELRVPATLDHLDAVIAFINAQLDAARCPRGIQGKIDLAVEEIYVNIARYAYDTQPGEVAIRCEVDDAASQVTLIFSDHGKPYNPLLADQPDLTAGVHDRPVGGLGIFLVRQLMDHVSYAFESGQNTLTLCKMLH